MGIPGHLLVDGFTECIEEKRPCHGVAEIPAMPASAAKLSQPVLNQPPAAKVVSSNTDSNKPGESSNTSRPRSWGSSNRRLGWRYGSSGETLGSIGLLAREKTAKKHKKQA